jgi:hypothetical protein
MIAYLRYRLADAAEAMPGFILRWWHWRQLRRLR